MAEAPPEHSAIPSCPRARSPRRCGKYSASTGTWNARWPSGRDTGKPFRYHDLGSAAYISRSGAVVSVGRLRFGGSPGWLAFTGDLRRERTFPTREVGYVRDAYTSQLKSSPTQISDPG